MKNIFFWKLLFRLISELRAKLILTIGKSSTDRLSNLFSTCSGNKVKKQIFHNLLVFTDVRTSSETCFEFWKFLFANLSKLLSTTSGEHFDKTFFKNPSSFFQDREKFIFWLSAKILQRGCPNCFVRVQKTFWRCGFLELFCFWCKFRFWAIFFLLFGRHFSVKLSKLLSPCLDKHFDGIDFFGKFFNLSSDFERNIFWTWLKTSQKSIQKPILRVLKTFWGNWLFGEFFDPYVY